MTHSMRMLVQSVDSEHSRVLTELSLALLSVGLVVLAMWPDLFVLVVIIPVIFLCSCFQVEGLLPVLLFLLPWGATLSGDTPLRDITSLLRLTVFIGLLVHAWATRIPILSRISIQIPWAIALYGLVITLFGLIASHATGPAIKSLLRSISCILIYFAILAWARMEKHIHILLRALLISTICVSLFGVYQALVGDYSAVYFRLYPSQLSDLVPWDGRITSFLNYSNSLAAYLNLVLPFALGCILVPVTATLKRLGVGCLILGSTALFFTQSRGGLFAYGTTLATAILCFTSNRKLRVALVAGLVVAVIAVLPVMAAYSEHFARVENSTMASRLALFAAAWNMFVSSPWIGVGYGGFRQLYGGIVEFSWIEGGVYDAHNLYLQVLAETGLIGLIAFGSVIGMVMRLSLRRFRHPRETLDRLVGFAVLAAVLSVLTHGFVDYFFEVSPQFGTLFWIVLGLLCVTERLYTVRDPRGGAAGL